MVCKYTSCVKFLLVLQADEFLDVFDGMSIGTQISRITLGLNDLTQLTLGLDRDSAILSSLFDERCGAVTKLISMAIEACKRRGKKIGICGFFLPT